MTIKLNLLTPAFPPTGTIWVVNEHAIVFFDSYYPVTSPLQAFNAFEHSVIHHGPTATSTILLIAFANRPSHLLMYRAYFYLITQVATEVPEILTTALIHIINSLQQKV